MVTTITVLVTNTHLNPQEKYLSKAYFKEKIIETDNPTQYFTALDKISFYRLSQPINKNQNVLTTFLNPIYIVQSGQPVALLLKNKNLILTSRGTALSSGRWGDMVKIKNEKNNKVLSGKVINFNKVSISL